MESWIVGLLVAYAVMAFAWGGFTAAVAEAKGYDKGPWFLGGLAFGPIAMLAVVGMPRLEDHPLAADYPSRYGKRAAERHSREPTAEELVRRRRMREATA